MELSNEISVVGMEQSGDNPYIDLLYGALEEEGVSVCQGVNYWLFPLTRSCLKYPDAEAIQLDWLYRYYMVNGFSGVRVLDCIITIGRSIFFLIDLLIISMLQTSVVWTVHNKSHHENKYPKTERIINEVVCRISDAITVKCEYAKHDIESTFYAADSDKICVVSDGNYISSYENTVCRREARMNLGINDKKFVYLYFGMIREYKGVPDLIEAFEELDHNNEELWVVGNPHSEDIRRKIEQQSGVNENISTVFKFIEQDRVQYYMNAADVLVLPYRHILNSGSVHLGLSFGLPIVTPNMGCIPEVISENNEFLYNSDDPEGLGDALKEVRDHDDLEGVGNANYKQALSQDWRKSARQLKSVYLKKA
ncbi:glycosyltransferase family 4 protein [Haloarcula sp. JP-Z28]|uniref:glycosyltransferase family 4 protein n=1 Tax=Haloarcula sp. JP-Z28 TaxID=2716715 RepID=UPI001404D411|nr:glycosyltransferase family 4 protein [Haloarcula sp. JP-Z28]NHN65062.1 glycosyltransferase family 4 protein [Haloarcula sp. JP-Z28]